jgi:hypothetical protein
VSGGNEGAALESRFANATTWVPGTAGVVLAWAAIHEWNYNRHHHYAPGPSGVLALGFLAGAAVAFSVMLIARRLRERAEHDDAVRAALTSHLASVDEHFQRLEAGMDALIIDDPAGAVAALVGMPVEEDDAAGTS